MGQPAPTTLEVEAFIRGAKLQATATNATITSVLEGILLGRFTSEARNGKTVVNVSENGSSTSWTVVAGLSPAEVMALASQALAYLHSNFSDPDAPEMEQLNRRVNRLRCSFRRALT